MPNQRYLVAVDSGFLLFLEAGLEECTRAFHELEKLKCEFILTDTPLQELQDMAQLGTKPHFQQLAEHTVRNLAKRGIKTPGLRSIQNGFAEVIANTLLEKCFLDGASKNDGLLVAEASLHDSNFLLTMENSLLSVDLQKINIVLMEKHSKPIQFLGSEVLLRVLQRLAE